MPELLLVPLFTLTLLNQPPFSVLYLTRQGDHINIVQGIKHILQSHSSLKKLSSQNPVEWPVTKVFLSKIKDKNGGKEYQGSELHRFTDGTIKSCADQALADLKSLDDRMRARLEWSDLELLRSIIILIDTQSWQESDSKDRLSEIKSALITITEHFHAPLEAKGTDLTSIIDEIEDIVEYARNYLRIGCEKYNKIWYSAPDSTKWPNILLVCELLLKLSAFFRP